MNPMRLALLALFFVPVCASADTINLRLSGNLQDGGTASGAVTVDTLNGYLIPFVVNVMDGGVTYTFIGSFFEGPNLNTNPFEYYSTTYTRADDNLLLYFSPNVLVGNNGGPLCTTAFECQGLTSTFNVSGGGPIAFTSLTVSDTPEPSSLLLTITGLMGGAKFLYGRRKG